MQRARSELEVQRGRHEEELQEREQQIEQDDGGQRTDMVASLLLSYLWRSWVGFGADSRDQDGSNAGGQRNGRRP